MAFLQLLITALPGMAASDTVGYWDARFFAPGVNETIQGLAAHGTNLFAAGPFNGAGEVAANGIARWDGARWHALGEGIPSPNGFNFAWAAASDGSNVWISGMFTNVGGVEANGLAQWNGSAWSDVGGFSGQAGGLVYTNGALYVAGNFTLPGETNGYAVGRWNGSAWETFGSVTPLCTSGCWTGMRVFLPTRWGLLAANFLGGAAYPGSFILWDGTNWQSMAGTPGAWPYSVATDGHNVYAACDVSVYSWDGTNWTQLGVADDWLGAVVCAQNKVWVGGQFDSINGVAAQKVACWDGTNWAQPGAGFREFDNVLALTATSDGAVFAGGQLWWSGSNAISHLAKFSEGEWRAVVSSPALGLNSPLGLLFSLTDDGSNLWAGGTFFTTGHSTNGRLARWDGSSWDFLPGDMQPFSGSVRAIAPRNGQLYIGGTFTNIGGTDFARVAHWNGTNWTGLGSGLNDRPEALLWSGTNVLVGGRFTNAGGVAASRIARWDGSAFHPLADGFDATVLTLAEFGGAWIAGGSFTNSGPTPVRGLARWDGTQWAMLGASLDGEAPRVTRLHAQGGKLYVAGQFTSAGGIAATNIAVWDGTNWAAIGHGIRGSSLNGLALYRGKLFVSGVLTNTLDERTALLCWDGTNWMDLPARLQEVLLGEGRLSGNSLLAWRDGLYVGGRFDRAGSHPVSGIARWVEATPGLRIQREGATMRVRAAGLRGALHSLDAATHLPAWSLSPPQPAYEDEVEWTVPFTSPAQFFRLRVKP